MFVFLVNTQIFGYWQIEAWVVVMKHDTHDTHVSVLLWSVQVFLIDSDPRSLSLVSPL